MNYFFDNSWKMYPKESGSFKYKNYCLKVGWDSPMRSDYVSILDILPLVYKPNSLMLFLEMKRENSTLITYLDIMCSLI